MPVGIQIENSHRGGDAMDRLGDLLRMLATGPIGIGQDHDVPILEVLASARDPIWPQHPRSRRGHEADLGEGVGILLALDKVDRRRGRGRDQFRQAIRNLRAIGLPFAQPLPSQ